MSALPFPLASPLSRDGPRRQRAWREVPLDALDFGALMCPDDVVMWGQAGAEPTALTSTLMSQRSRLQRFSTFLGISLSEAVDPAFSDVVSWSAYGGGGRNRALAQAGLLDPMPVHYSALAPLIRSGSMRVDVLLLQVAPPGADGVFSLGISHEYLLAALPTARIVIAEVNEQLPFVHGEAALRACDFDLVVRTSHPPLTMPAGARTPGFDAIAEHIGGLVEDGSTLQMGIGALPQAVLAGLASHRHLGVHSGAISDAVAVHMQSGLIDNSAKPFDRGVTVCGALLGGETLYRHAHRNPAIRLCSTDYTHSLQVMAALPRFVAINSAIEVDLSGQVNAETADGVYLGAVGGIVDFMRGAAASHGGLPIVALASTARGRSRIVGKLGGPVTLARSDTAIVVTEYGVADLRGLTLSQRRQRLIAIADPHCRAMLDDGP